MYNNKTKMQILAKRDMAKADQKLKEFAMEGSFEYDQEYFFDQFSGQFFQSTKAMILAAELAVNRQLNETGECPLRVYYDILGIEDNAIDDYIWSHEMGHPWIDFDHIYVDYESDNPDYHLIVMIPEPELKDNKEE